MDVKKSDIGGVLLKIPEITNEDLSEMLNRSFDGLKIIYVVDAARRLGVFDKASKPAKASDLCASLGIEEMTGTIFLNALVKLGFLECRDGFYSNSEISDNFMCSDSPMSQKNKIDFITRNLGHWSNLVSILREGQPIQKLDDIFKPEKLPMMLEGNYGGSVGLVVRMLSEKIDMTSVKDIMGIGAGSLLYIIGMNLSFEGTKGSVIEREVFSEPGSSLISRYGTDTRMIIGDYKKSLEGQYDLVFSSLTHACLESEIAESVSAGLRAGGYLVVRRTLPEVAMDPFRDLDINLTRLEVIPKGVIHHHGDEHAVEYIARMTENGVCLIDRFNFLPGSEVLIFRKYRGGADVERNGTHIPSQLREGISQEGCLHRRIAPRQGERTRHRVRSRKYKPPFRRDLRPRGRRGFQYGDAPQARYGMLLEGYCQRGCRAEGLQRTRLRGKVRHGLHVPVSRDVLGLRRKGYGKAFQGSMRVHRTHLRRHYRGEEDRRGSGLHDEAVLRDK